ncbi:hypothetical protein KZ480_11000 [Glaesserella parasuis]|nr:hypothetical protein [Glaesserella parasuis]
MSQLKKHTFNIRYYANKYEKYNFRDLVKHFKNDSMPVVPIGNYARRVCIYSDNEVFDNSISGYFTTYRDDILYKGNRSTGNEELINLEEDESIIERNYFILFYGDKEEILLYQNSSLFGKIKHFNAYLTNLTQFLSNNDQFSNISMLEIGAEEYANGKKRPLLKQVEYKLARPKRKTPRDGEDPWVQEQFDEMANLGVNIQKVVLSNYSKKGLLTKTWDTVNTLLGNDQTRTLKITLLDAEEPIDLLHNVLKDRFYLAAPSRKEVELTKIFKEIRSLRKERDATLKNYLDERKED